MSEKPNISRDPLPSVAVRYRVVIVVAAHAGLFAGRVRAPGTSCTGQTDQREHKNDRPKFAS